MKKQNFFILIISILLSSCSKSEEEMALFEVVEFKTNTPVSSARINLLRCSDYDLVFGCQATMVTATGWTDNAGKFSIGVSELNKAKAGIKIHKPGFWEADGHTGKNYLTPEAWINLHLKRQNTYTSPRLFFRYDITGESGNGRFIPFSIPIDTVIKVRGFGNEVNKLKWEVGNGTCILNEYCIENVLANGMLTQSLDKSGTTTITVAY